MIQDVDSILTLFAVRTLQFHSIRSIVIWKLLHIIVENYIEWHGFVSQDSFNGFRLLYFSSSFSKSQTMDLARLKWNYMIRFFSFSQLPQFASDFDLMLAIGLHFFHYSHSPFQHRWLMHYDNLFYELRAKILFFSNNFPEHCFRCSVFDRCTLSTNVFNVQSPKIHCDLVISSSNYKHVNANFVLATAEFFIAILIVIKSEF